MLLAKAFILSQAIILRADLSLAVDPFADATRPMGSCFDEMIQIFLRTYEGEGFALLPPRVDSDAFVLRMILDNEEIVRSPSLMQTLRNKYLRSVLGDLKFGYEHQRDRYPREVLIGYDADGTPVEVERGYFIHEQDVYEFPDLAGLRFHMNLFQSRHLHRFVFIPTALDGGLASHLEWMRALARSEFPVSATGDIFQHDMHDHVLAFLFLPPRLAEALRQSIAYLIAVYDSPQTSELLRRHVEYVLERMAYRIEAASASLQAAISKLKPYRLHPRKRRLQQEKVEKILKYFGLLDKFSGSIGANRMFRHLVAHAKRVLNSYSIEDSTLPIPLAASIDLEGDPIEFREAEISKAAQHLIELLLGRKRINQP